MGASEEVAVAAGLPDFDSLNLLLLLLGEVDDWPDADAELKAVNHESERYDMMTRTIAARHGKQNALSAAKDMARAWCVNEMVLNEVSHVIFTFKRMRLNNAQRVTQCNGQGARGEYERICACVVCSLEKCGCCIHVLLYMCDLYT